MFLHIDENQIVDLVGKQLSNMLTFNIGEKAILSKCVSGALDACERCFSHSTNKYYKREDEVCFNPFHSGQYCIFLYWLSRAVWKENANSDFPARIYYLNKIMNAVDLYYEVALPEIFDLDHPLASVMGRASYSNCFFFSQGCTVGNNKGVYPVIGKNVTMYAGSKIIGNAHIGDNCVIAANAFVIDQNVPANSVVFGSSPSLVIKCLDAALSPRQTQRWRHEK